MMTIHRRGLLALGLAAIATPALAHDYTHGDLRIGHPWSRAASANTNGAGFMTIRNTGAQPDRLVSASTPIARTVELHTHIRDGEVMRALAAFQRAIAGFDSPYDRSRWGGQRNAISASARRGERLFFGERLECYHCHGGFLFSDNVMHARLIAPEMGFHDTGVARTGGIGEHTGDARQMGAFRTPSLRNIALTAPYMHDGSMATLDDVIRHYERGGRHRGPHTSSLLAGFRLTPQERRDLIAFLESLTDRSVTADPRFANPFVTEENRR